MQIFPARDSFRAPETGLSRVILSADDYGLSPGVGEAIRDLIVRRRLTATSCMTVFPEWPDEGRKLAELADSADLGLHLTLTDHSALAPMPMLAPGGRFPDAPSLMLRAFLRRLDTTELCGEIERQIDAFVSAIGRPPSHIDSHHHVHNLPQIRDAVVLTYEKRLSGTGAYVRWCGDRLPNIWRRRVSRVQDMWLAAASRSMRRAALGRGIPMNDALTGLYYLASKRPYGDLFPRFLKGVSGRTIVHCHPGRLDDTLRLRDRWTAFRELEWRYLRGDAFADALRDAGVEAGRFWDPAVDDLSCAPFGEVSAAPVSR